MTRFDKNLQTVIDDMVETMRDASGVGLAAPQIGLSERLIVVEYYEREEDEEVENAPKKVWTIVNPEIIKTSEEKLVGVEGCLSIPNLVGEVERHAMVQIKGLNRHGKPVKVKADGWLARIFQHEIDHLDGVLYTDRLVSREHAKIVAEGDGEQIEYFLADNGSTNGTYLNNQKIVRAPLRDGDKRK